MRLAEELQVRLFERDSKTMSDHAHRPGQIEKLNAAFVKAIQSDEGREFFRRKRMIARASTPDGLAAFNKEQIASWERWVKESGLQPQ
jgi:tripartite-type tricarboxylate transporter receptor subunit TctC